MTDLDRLCGKRFERSGGRDVCVLPVGHDDQCENVLGQRLPIVVLIPLTYTCHELARAQDPDNFDPNCPICTNGLRQEEMG